MRHVAFWRRPWRGQVWQREEKRSVSAVGHEPLHKRPELIIALIRLDSDLLPGVLNQCQVSTPIWGWVRLSLVWY